MQVGKILIKLPKKVRKGEVFKLRFIIFHPMETGRRRDPVTGELIPAHYLTRVRVYYDETLVNDVTTSPALSRNPYFMFKLKAVKSGTIRVEAEDNKGNRWSASAPLRVEDSEQAVRDAKKKWESLK
ncbi:MAG: thiosulfate oxidation carrier complex protein SoxZ [Aquificae bacterium]|nr:thiosulfate oxidation carrier complex protein SoxZ [Aquificota bacterium]